MLCVCTHVRCVCCCSRECASHYVEGGQQRGSAQSQREILSVPAAQNRIVIAGESWSCEEEVGRL